MASLPHPGLLGELSGITTRVLGREPRNLTTLLTRIGIRDPMSLAELPLSQNKTELEQAIKGLTHEGALNNAGLRTILEQYDRVFRVCVAEARIPRSTRGPPKPTVATPRLAPGKPPYVRRSVFMAFAPERQPPAAAPEAPKRGRPAISRSDDRTGPFWVATKFAEGSSTFKMFFTRLAPRKRHRGTSYFSH